MKKRVTGLGGVFFKSADPDALKDWYAKHLHIESGEHGTLFKWRQDEDPDKAGYTAWSVFPEDTTYFQPASRDFMFNYIVENLLPGNTYYFTTTAYNSVGLESNFSNVASKTIP